MNKYKFRAECRADVDIFFSKFKEGISNIKVEPIEDSPIDVYVTFESKFHLAKMIQVAKEVQDGHVIAQTIRPLAKFTGERNYSI